MSSNNKVEMSLDDIIKTNRKAGPKKGSPKKGGPKKGGITKKIGVNARKGKLGNKVLGIKKRVTGGQQSIGKQALGNTAATKRLVQKLVKKALAQTNNTGGRKANQQQTRVVRQVIQHVQKPARNVNRRSQVITKAPRTETVIVRRVVKPRSQPRQQVIREVIVQEPRQRIVSQPVRRFQSNNRQQVVYVEERSNYGGAQQRSFGGQQRSFGNQQQRSFGNQQQRQNFGGQRRNNGGIFQRTQRRQNTDPFYEPASFLQR